MAALKVYVGDDALMWRISGFCWMNVKENCLHIENWKETQKAACESMDRYLCQYWKERYNNK
jgi:hypothetical protein